MNSLVALSDEHCNQYNQIHHRYNQGDHNACLNACHHFLTQFICQYHRMGTYCVLVDLFADSNIEKAEHCRRKAEQNWIALRKMYQIGEDTWIDQELHDYRAKLDEYAQTVGVAHGNWNQGRSAAELESQRSEEARQDWVDRSEEGRMEWKYWRQVEKAINLHACFREEEQLAEQGEPEEETDEVGEEGESSFDKGGLPHSRQEIEQWVQNSTEVLYRLGFPDDPVENDMVVKLLTQMQSLAKEKLCDMADAAEAAGQ